MYMCGCTCQALLAAYTAHSYIDSLLTLGANCTDAPPVCELWLEVYGCSEVAEGAGCLPRAEVQQAQVVRNQPLKRVQVQCTLQARNGSNVALRQEIQTGQSEGLNMASSKLGSTGRPRVTAQHARRCSVVKCKAHVLPSCFSP
jgi:hypothetical protein